MKEDAINNALRKQMCFMFKQNNKTMETMEQSYS